MTTVIEFLTARLDEDEAVARAVQDNSAPFNGQWYNDAGHALRTQNDWVLAYEHHGKTFAPGLLDHIARHDPARVLREVAAKRAILELADDATGLDMSVDNDRLVGSRDQVEDPYIGDLILRQLAQAYSDHSDFNPEWSTT